MARLLRHYLLVAILIHLHSENEKGVAFGGPKLIHDDEDLMSNIDLDVLKGEGISPC